MKLEIEIKFHRLVVASLAILFAVAASASVSAQDLASEEELYEGKEFANAFADPKDNPDLPNVLLIGDSISNAYTVDVRKLLVGKADVFRIPSNGKYAAFGSKNLNKWLGNRKWDVIHFNWGLWDICYRNPKSKTQGHRDKVNGTLTASPDQYRESMEKIVARLKKTEATLIWCATTPVPEHEAGRKVGDEIKYNAIAESIMLKNDILVNDLHAHALKRLPEIQIKKGDVHFTPDGSAYLAEQVAESISAALEQASEANSTPFSGQTNSPYDGSWESLQKMPVPAWFDDGKIGIFIHWGPYSAIGYRKGGRGYAEHVPKMIYEDPKHYYPYLKKRWGAHPPELGYKDIVPEFKAENWNPDEWAALFSEAGAKYVVLTAEHHDGWANWDSELTPWNAVDKGPKRDLVGDLGKSLRAKGLKYAPSYHRERHTGFFAKDKYVVHSEPRPDIAEEIRRVPEAAMLYGPEFSYNKAYVDDYVARWKEIQTKYQPDMLWVDDFPIYTRDGNQVRKGTMKPEIKYFDDQVRGMITDFMNDGAARGADVYVNNKGKNRNWPDGVGCLEKDNLKLKVIGPKWQSCTTFGTSFGFLKGDKYKSIESVIHEMIEVISRNGNFLVNIGPMADGTIPPPQLERLQAMGDWLKINGEAIYGTRYWKECEQKGEHLAFTAKGKSLYAIMLAEPTTPFVITGTAGWNAGQVKSVELLGSESEIGWKMTPAGLQIVPPADLGSSQMAWSFEIVTDRDQHVPNVIDLDVTEALKGTKAVDLEGGVGKARNAIQPTVER